MLSQRLGLLYPVLLLGQASSRAAQPRAPRRRRGAEEEGAPAPSRSPALLRSALPPSSTLSPFSTLLPFSTALPPQAMVICVGCLGVVCLGLRKCAVGRLAYRAPATPSGVV